MAAVFLTALSPISKETTEEKVTSLLPLATGKQAYDILTDKPKNPQIIEVTVDPLDVKVGQTQIVTVTIKNNKTDSITGEDTVLGTAITDNKTVGFSLKLIRAEGTTELTTVWQGEWVRDDSYNSNYQLQIKAKTAKSENQVELTFR